MAGEPSALGSLVRLTPLLLDELPAHPSIPDPSSTPSPPDPPLRPRPDLSTFFRAVLDEGAAVVSPSALRANFTPAGSKSARPARSRVDVLKRDIPAAVIDQIAWDSPPVPRPRPRVVGAEHWFVRRSRHENVSSRDQTGSASWEEFVYGLRDEHSKHEQDFTPTVYDARHVLDWNQALGALEKGGELGGYTHATMSRKPSPWASWNPRA